MGRFDRWFWIVPTTIFVCYLVVVLIIDWWDGLNGL